MSELTNESSFEDYELEAFRQWFRNKVDANICWMDSETGAVFNPQNMVDVINELLALREAVAPQMADVDALANTVYLSVESPAGIDISSLNRLANLARTAIIAHAQEKQRADEAEARYDRFLTEWFGDNTDFERLVDAADSHVDPDCWLSTECRRIHEVFLKRFEEQQNERRED